MAREFFLSLIIVAAAVAEAGVLSITPAPQGLTPDGHGGVTTNSWWWNRFNEKQAQIKAGGSEVVFIGDSITDGWEYSQQWKKYFAGEPYKAINLGFGGARTEHILWNIEHGELDGYKAKAIMLMIGLNNSLHRADRPIDILVGIKAIIDAIFAKQPQARLILHPIFPVGRDENDPHRRRCAVVNRELWKLADGKKIIWCDFTSQFLTADGFLPAGVTPDRVHPGAYGYEVWAAAVIPRINAILSGDAIIPSQFPPFVDASNFHREREDRTVYPDTRVGSAHWWVDRLRSKRSQIVDSKGEFDIVFYGDSITHFWEDRSGELYGELCKRYSILNLGYAGDCTQQLIWRGEYGELDGYKTKCVMLMIGTNNAVRDKPENVAKGVRKVLDLIAAKQPQATTLLLPIFPRGATAADKYRVSNEKVNAIIKGFADGKKVVWCDFNAKFLDAEGNLPKTIMPDLLHPNRDGYIIWRDAVLPHFEKICGK